MTSKRMGSVFRCPTGETFPCPHFTMRCSISYRRRPVFLPRYVHSDRPSQCDAVHSNLSASWLAGRDLYPARGGRVRARLDGQAFMMTSFWEATMRHAGAAATGRAGDSARSSTGPISRLRLSAELIRPTWL